MQRSVFRSLHRLALLGLVIACLWITGCVPSVGWLPDSSGIVYTAGKDFNQLILYDLKKGEPQVLVADTGAGTLWPAVSPDGKRIAVAKVIIEPKQKQTRLQVIIYDRQGKEVQRSKTLDWLTLDQDCRWGRTRRIYAPTPNSSGRLAPTATASSSIPLGTRESMMSSPGR